METDRSSTPFSPPLEVNVLVSNMDIGQLSSDDDNEQGTRPFTVPKKTSRLTTLLSRRQSPLPLPTGNKFQTLTNLTAEQEISAKARTATKPPTPVAIKPRKTLNPPPLVLAGTLSSHKNLLAELKLYIKKPFTLKYTANNTIVYTTDKVDYATLKLALQETFDHEFHTYTPREQKRHAFVLLGLQGDPNLDEIKAALEDEYDIQVFNIFRMITKRSPLFLVVVSNEVTLKSLQTSVKTLLCTRVKWERRRDERLLSQCRRCQAWSHATSNCFRTPNSVKCASAHFSRDCQITLGQSVKCYNCKGPHVASSTACPVYINRIKSQQTHTEEPPAKTYVKAPLPVTNPWKKIPAGPSVTTTTAARKDQPQLLPSRQPTAQTPSTQSDFSHLLNELNTFNSIIDLKQTIAAVATLNKMLSGVTDALQVILIMQDFVSIELPKFKIIRSAP